MKSNSLGLLHVYQNVIQTNEIARLLYLCISSWCIANILTTAGLYSPQKHVLAQEIFHQTVLLHERVGSQHETNTIITRN